MLLLTVWQKNCVTEVRTLGENGLANTQCLLIAVLAVIDVENGLQPMKRTVEGHEFVITYNGELYNTNDIRNDLKSHGYEFTTASDTEVLLYAYIHYGEKMLPNA